MTRAVVAVETVATVDFITMPDGTKPQLSRSHRTDATGGALRLLRWSINNAEDIPLAAIGSIVDLVETQVMVLKFVPAVARPTVELLFGWLRQLDIRHAEVTIPGASSLGGVASDDRRRMIE
jgi:hypothetical protein